MPYTGVVRDPMVKPEWGAGLDESVVQALGLVAYVPLFEQGGSKVYDVRRQKQTSIAGTVGSSTWAANTRGAVVALDGSSNYIDLGTGLAFTKNTPFSVGVTFKTSAATCILAANWNNGASPGWELYLSGGPLQFFMANAGSTAGYVVHGAKTLSDGTWHTAVMTYDGSASSGGVKLYVDGLPDALTSTSNTDPGALVDSGLLIGDRAGSPFKAAMQIEQAWVFNRVVSASEVAELSGQPYSLFLSANVRRFYGTAQVWQQTLAELLTLSDTRKAFVSKVVAETLGLLDGRSALAGKLLNEALSLADALAATLNGGGHAFSQTLTEALAWTDARQAGIVKRMAEALSLTDSRILGLARQLGETLGFTDAVQATGTGLALLPLLLSGAFGDGLTKSGSGDSVEEIGGKA